MQFFNKIKIFILELIFGIDRYHMDVILSEDNNYLLKIRDIYFVIYIYGGVIYGYRNSQHPTVKYYAYSGLDKEFIYTQLPSIKRYGEARMLYKHIVKNNVAKSTLKNNSTIRIKNIKFKQRENQDI